jgi:hypothetical protein
MTSSRKLPKRNETIHVTKPSAKRHSLQRSALYVKVSNTYEQSSIDSTHSSHASQVIRPHTVHQSIVSTAWLGSLSTRLQVCMSPRSNVPTYPPMNPHNGSARYLISADRDVACHLPSTKPLSTRPQTYIFVTQKPIDSTTTLLRSVDSRSTKTDKIPGNKIECACIAACGATPHLDFRRPSRYRSPATMCFG